MRFIIQILLASMILISSAASLDAPMQERGVRSQSMEDVFLVGADDWHASIAATPLAIYSTDNGSVNKPLLMLPREVNAGSRMGFIEMKDLLIYGGSALLQDFSEANVTSIVIHGSGDKVKDVVAQAKKEGIKAYVTATLEPPQTEDSILQEEGITGLSSIGSRDIGPRMQKFLNERATILQQEDSRNGASVIEEPKPVEGGLSLDWYGKNGGLYCPVNPSVKESLYNQVEQIIDDYEADGVMLYDFGFDNESYCFCSFCKEQFYKDTGIDLTRIALSNYNIQKWREWREDQVLLIAEEVRNITRDLGPVKFGVAIDNPMDRSQGYNFAKLSQVSDFVIISPVSALDISVSTGITQTPVYVRLSNGYVEHTISTQNVAGGIKYIEDAVKSGAAGFAFEYNVVYTPLWYELQPPSKSARWLLGQLNGRTLGIGDVYWQCDDVIRSNNSSELSIMVSSRWESSPGVVLAGDNYSSALEIVPTASYLNWPILFVGSELTDGLRKELQRLKSKEAIIAGPVSSSVRDSLSKIGISVNDSGSDSLLLAMAGRSERPEAVVFTNSHDMSLIQPRPRSEVMRADQGDILMDVEVGPTVIPGDSDGEVVRINITLTNGGESKIADLRLVDLFRPGKLIRWSSNIKGTLNVTDPITRQPSLPEGAFFNGSLLFWNAGTLEPGASISLPIEVELMHALDGGWKQPLDYGIQIGYADLKENITVRKEDSGRIKNITFPAGIPIGTARVSWIVQGNHSMTMIRFVSPGDLKGELSIRNCSAGKEYKASIPMLIPGRWIFNISSENDAIYTTENYSINVTSTLDSINVTAFYHTMVPRLSLTSAMVAAARKAMIVDVGLDPQDLIPIKAEESLKSKVEGWKLQPKYLIIVGDPGSMPFVDLGVYENHNRINLFRYDIYRDYQLVLDDDNNTEVCSGRIMGLSVYDASQLVARTLAYDRLTGEWKNKSMTISTPAAYPWNPIPVRIKEYMSQAGLDAKDLRWEEATNQKVTSMMNNGMNIVHFDHHGVENAWGLSDWTLTDGGLYEDEIKQLTLAPQTTTANACLTSRMKGATANISGTLMYFSIPLERSMALAFIRAGSVNYLGATTYSWIFVGDDYPRRLYQALIYENCSIGEANELARTFYQMKFSSSTKIPQDIPGLQTVLNQTVSMNLLIGDPAFRPTIPRTPPLPYKVNITSKEDEPISPGDVSGMAVDKSGSGAALSYARASTAAYDAAADAKSSAKTNDSSNVALDEEINATSAVSRGPGSGAQSNTTSSAPSSVSDAAFGRVSMSSDQRGNLSDSGMNATNASAMAGIASFSGIALPASTIGINLTDLHRIRADGSSALMLSSNGSLNATDATVAQEHRKAAPSHKKGAVTYSITPINESATDWLYWISFEAVGGGVSLNSPTALIGEVTLRRDAEEVVVKENGRVVWHFEVLTGDHKQIMWPILRPRIGETRTFVIEFKLIPEELQTINISEGWNMVSIHLVPSDPKLSRYFKDKPYRGIFSVSGKGWTYSMVGLSQNVTTLEAGRGYLIDSRDDFSIELHGTPVELPFRLKLQKGWNIIGAPFNYSIALQDIGVNAEHRRYTYQEAVRKGLVSAFLWSLDGKGKWLSLDAEGSLEPGRGYLIEALGDCRLEFN